jgi:ParB family chromosome partitioning protein
MSVATLSCQPIALAAINFTTEWSLHPWVSTAIPEELRQSFCRIGILHKPILLTKAGGRFDIICGFRRLQFLLSNTRVKQIDCLVLAQTTEPAAILDILLTDQSISHPLSLVEKAQFIEICSRFFRHQDIVPSYLQRLQLSKRSATINELLDILKQDPLMIAEIHADRLQEKMVSELLRLPEESDRIAMIQLFKELAMGDGKQKRFFTLIRDLSFRLGSSIAAYLNTRAIQEILKHRQLNIPQKVLHLGNLLQHQLNPFSLQAEEEFAKRVGSLHLPACCTISHSPSFEKDEITLSITFKNFSDCQVRMPELKKSLL